ncbi:hypothetical protein [Methanohalophilus sp.]|uniref:hypothetical protein n=1 Tax=Methanohalophilus sp. TaxID=1966352 RepID=UPI00261316C5|nr:hypothetical protein [Methanohalophilus sp.]MDK2891957.1 hypothetical protein [Methanohalophilus sp.]
MRREFTDRDMEIFNKLAPEAGGNNISSMGHPFPFILRPVSHKFAESAEDFKERLSRLSMEEIEYLADLVMEGTEEIRTLEDEDIDSFFEVVSEKVSAEKVEALKNKLGIF